MRPNQTCKESGCLLEKLAELAGCNYLSDLRCALSFFPLFPFFALPQILAEDYSVKEWNDAVGYILGTRTSFSSAREAYGFCCMRLPNLPALMPHPDLL